MAPLDTASLLLSLIQGDRPKRALPGSAGNPAMGAPRWPERLMQIICVEALSFLTCRR
jgi:hypothetical protein